MLTVFTEFGLVRTAVFMVTNISFRKLSVTVVAFLFAMKLLFMVLLEIDIVHLSTLLALFNVPSTVSEMGGDFRLRKHLKAVVALLHWLTH